ncbi:MAG: Lsr2 family protein [Aeromicrobium sp.]
MAKKTIEVITSDLSGEELEPGQGETIRFSIGGSDYSIDLTDAEADELRSTFDKYVKVASRASSRGTQSTSRKSSGSGRTPEELAHIRAWAKENGHTVSERGRIKSEVLEAFDAAQN